MSEPVSQSDVQHMLDRVTERITNVVREQVNQNDIQPKLDKTMDRICDVTRDHTSQIERKVDLVAQDLNQLRIEFASLVARLDAAKIEES